MKPNNDLPQVLTFAQVARGGKVSLKKAVKQHLGGDAFYFDVRDEVLLTCTPSVTTESVEVRGSRMVLSESVMDALGLDAGSLLAMMERGNAAGENAVGEKAIALKTAVVEERSGDHARLVDVETAQALTRVVYTTPLPDVLLPQLRTQHAETRLRYDVRGFLKGRETLPAWQARQLLECPDPGDDALCDKLVEARLSEQADDGSWDGNVLLTARNLRELADLGLTRDDAPVQCAVALLVARPQSEHNPGQWFGCDELVAEQAAVVASRQARKGGRFRQIKTSEKKRVVSGDPLIEKPCGPRIMWPNGVVIEALLKLGYEDLERMQTVLRTLTINDWCECGYQHGLSDWRRTEPMDEAQMDAFEQGCIAQYRYGGVRTLKWLTDVDAPFRVAHSTSDEGDVYALRMPDHIQGCEFITTRSLSQVQHPLARRFAEAHLWRFAGIQRADGLFPDEKYGTGFSQIGILEAVARYDHPASRVILLRALPWIVDAQNADGSWGVGARKDVETLAMVRVLCSPMLEGFCQ